MEQRDYGTAIDRGQDGALREFGCPLSKEGVRELAEWLVRLTPGQRLLAFKNRHLTNALLVVQALSKLAFQLRQIDPQRAWAAAEAAVEFSTALAGRRGQRTSIADARAEAWMQKANLLRLRDQLDEAEKCWRWVHRLRDCGSCEPGLSGDIALFEAALRRAQHRYPEARDLLGRAINLFDGISDALSSTRARISLGIVELYSGKPEEATSTTLAAAEQIRPGMDPYLGLIVHHNLILCFAEAGAFDSARRVFRRARLLYSALETPVLAARAVWVLGRIKANQGGWASALEAFTFVRKELTRRFLPFDASLAALEESLAHLHLGNTTAVRDLALAMHPIFVAKGVPTEASAALLLFAEAARRDAATVAQLETLIGDLKDRLAPPSQRGAQGRFMA